jgi:uncharacterized protein YecT (DUF1311 family)
MVRLLTAVLASLSVTPSLAANCEGESSRYEDISCAIAAFDRADAELNVAYRQLAALRDEEGKRMLREAQRAWVVFRDADARFDAYPENEGSLGRHIMVNRRTDLTSVRIKDLKAWLSQKK